MAMAMKRVSPPKFQVKATTSWKSQAYSTLVALLYFLFNSSLPSEFQGKFLISYYSELTHWRKFLCLPFPSTILRQ